MEAAIVAAIVLFRRIDKTAARLLWPYAAWVASRLISTRRSGD